MDSWKSEELKPQDEFKFETVKQMTADEQKSVKEILDAMILKHQAKQLIGWLKPVTKEEKLHKTVNNSAD